MEYNYNLSNDKLKRIVFLVLIIITWLIGSYIIIDLKVQEQHLIRVPFLAILIDIIVFHYISVIVHELGHLVALKIYGYKFRIILVGPFILIKDRNKYKIRIKITPLMFSGITLVNLNDSVKCTEDYNNFIKHFKFITLGGVFINIFFLIIGIVLLNFSRYSGFLIFFININSIIGCCYPNGDIYVLNKMRKKEIIVYISWKNLKWI